MSHRATSGCGSLYTHGCRLLRQCVHMVVLHSLALARVRYAPVLTARTVVPPRFARYPALPPSCRCSHTHADTELARILASPPFLTPLSRALPSGRACKESRLTSSRARIPALCPRTVLSWILVTRRAISRAPCPCQCSHCSIHGDCKDRTPPALPRHACVITLSLVRSLQGPSRMLFPSSVLMPVLAL